MLTVGVENAPERRGRKGEIVHSMGFTEKANGNNAMKALGPAKQTTGQVCIWVEPSRFPRTYTSHLARLTIRVLRC